MNKEIIAAALKTAHHYYDFETNILYMTPDFEKKSNIYGTAEYNLLNDILDQQPDIHLEVFKSNRGASDLITYTMMKDFIDLMPDAGKYMKEYLRMKQKSHAYRSSYKFVTEWFKTTFPYYRKLLKTDENGNLVWNTESWNKLLKEFAPKQTETGKKSPSADEPEDMQATA